MQGIAILTRDSGQAQAEAAQLRDLLRDWGLEADACVHSPEHRMDTPGLLVRATLAPGALACWAPGFDTLSLCPRVGLDIGARVRDMEIKIAIEMLAAPLAYQFPSAREWCCSIRLRSQVALAARNARVAFATQTAERPLADWSWDDEAGWRLRDGVDLVGALERAVHPQPGAALSSFSCYRATEHVLLLGLARELQRVDANRYRQLQARWRREALRSEVFVSAFLREHGSNASPLPVGYYVPGDRVWFRNPDEASSNVTGYEGSWVIYLGNGKFCNFWEEKAPYSLIDKCIEIYHWRDAVVPAGKAGGEDWIDEARVAHQVQSTQADPRRKARVLRRMMRLRDLSGVYANGGCLDRTREHLRWLHAPDHFDGGGYCVEF